MIEDILSDERGKKCNCVCPNCKDTFIARLGEKNAYHFAHSGEGCDEEIAYLIGLYNLVREFTLGSSVTLPKLILYWACYSTPFTTQNFFDRIRFFDDQHNYNRTIVKESISIKYDAAEIIFHGKRPKALLLEYHSRKMALVIKPPATVCKEFSAEPYSNLATIELNASDIPFGMLRKDEILGLLNEKFRDCRWLYSPMAICAIDKINEENAALIETMRKQKSLEKHNQSKQRETAVAIHSNHAQGTHNPKAAIQKAPLDEEKLRKGKAEVLNLFTQQKKAIYDSYGQRWIKCRKCNEIKPLEEFDDYDYGGPCKVNSGTCRACLRKTNS